MPLPRPLAVLRLLALSILPAWADQAATQADLESLHPEKLSGEQLTALMPGAKISRVSGQGNAQYWTHREDGTMNVFNENRFGAQGSAMGGRTAYRPGTWRISEDGRYCVHIEWKHIEDEDWCRYVFKTDQGYYTSKAESDPAAKVFKLEIAR